MILAFVAILKTFVAILKGINPFDKLNHDIRLKNLGVFTYKNDFQKSTIFFFQSLVTTKKNFIQQQQVFLTQRLLTFSVYYSVMDFASIFSLIIFFHSLKKSKSDSSQTSFLIKSNL